MLDQTYGDTMTLTATQLRADIYRLLDRVLESGEALLIERNGRMIRIAPVEPAPLDHLFPPRPDLILGDPEELVHVDWWGTWSEAGGRDA